ncbi:hypothetical protein CHU98_g2890 [Xylaria longipes]|nr:hypothetical protein CHU98_g2890 [Xylaria longipes]
MKNIQYPRNVEDVKEWVAVDTVAIRVEERDMAIGSIVAMRRCERATEEAEGGERGEETKRMVAALQKGAGNTNCGYRLNVEEPPRVRQTPPAVMWTRTGPLDTERR